MPPLDNCKTRTCLLNVTYVLPLYITVIYVQPNLINQTFHTQHHWFANKIQYNDSIFRLHIDPQTGTITVTKDGTFDYEMAHIYYITIMAQDDDGKGLSRSNYTEIHVLDANDNAPSIRLPSEKVSLNEDDDDFYVPLIIDVRKPISYVLKICAILWEHPLSFIYKSQMLTQFRNITSHRCSVALKRGLNRENWNLVSQSKGPSIKDIRIVRTSRAKAGMGISGAFFLSLYHLLPYTTSGF